MITGVKLEFPGGGLEKLLKKFKNTSVQTSDAVEEEVIKAGFRIERTAKKSIQQQSQGAVYDHFFVTIDGNAVPIEPRTTKHTASKEGDAPNTDTGRLVSSIFVEPKREDGKAMVSVGTNLKYGTHLEFGTKNMEARPWLGPANKQNEKKNKDAITKAARNVLKQGGKG